jgi:hypothetical protein
VDPAINEFHLSRHFIRQFEIVRNDHHGQSLIPVELAEEIDNSLARDHIQISRRLIREKKLGSHDESAGDSHPLLLASREFANAMIYSTFKSDLCQDSPCHVRRFSFRNSGDEGRDQGVFEGVKLGQQVVKLKNESNILIPQFAEFPFIHIADATILVSNHTLGGRLKGAHDVEECGFASPRCTRNAEALCLLNNQINPFQDMDHELIVPE